jgi:DMSO/TMAO reductase YedYZ molybdopterin-dependent catalytic subunit
MAIAVAGCTAAPCATPAAATPGAASDYKIVITGGTTSPVTLTYADLGAMRQADLKNTTMVKMNGVRITSDWSGVLLSDVLARAGLPAGNLSITMAAPDGFMEAYTMDQLEGALIGLAKNGTALDTDVNGDNAIQLVIPEHVGHEWIKVPTSIEISAA